MSYTPGTFCWFEISTHDPDAARAFYSRVIGWEINDVAMGGISAYPLIVNGGVPVGGVMTAPPGTPNLWNAYLAVEDVDASAAAVRKLGGAVLMDAQDIPGVGRFAVVADPQGAVFSLFRSAESTSTDAPRVAGGFHWTELSAADVDAVLPFYKGAFGFETEAMAMPMGTYHILTKGGVQCGGAMTTMHPEVPPMWLPWVHVTDCDAAAARAVSAGGKLASDPFDVDGIGRMVIVIDPTGAALGVITPAPGPMS
jgi:predicted enzyme related to lactoylglutathione lyase